MTPPAPDREILRAWLLQRVAAAADPPRAGGIDPDAPFSSQGLDSLRLAAVAGDLETVLGRAVDPTVLFEHPTVTALVAHLTAPRQAAARGPSPPAAGEPIAIVGLACRMPGAADAAAFWHLLETGGDAVGVVPPDRWDAAALFDPDPAAPGRATSRWGGFLADVALFDAGFFRISAEEARRMDPQQRLLLETAWDALEDAGLVPARLRGSRTAVFVGISVNDYAARQLQDPMAIGAHTPTGASLAVAANRLSYVFDLRGPSVAVDTACSSSLVAAHLACRALRSGECDRALVGGVNLLLDPEVTIGLSKAGMLAPDGRCKAFDARADGYVRAEGCGVVALEPLATALAAGDRVYAVIRGTAVNQDGASNGLTAPNPAAQRAVLEAALADAGVEPAAVRYVECHGTGTFLGDPIEARSLGAVVGPGRPPAAPCLIGSVKSNIGHAESAAGIAGLIKVALALHHGRLPPSLHFTEPNPHIPFAELGLEVVTGLRPLPPGEGPHVAGVSSFGFGGTNAHVVLESAPAAAPARTRDGPLVLPVSARSRAGLRRILTAWADRLEDARAEEVTDLVHTAAVRRTHHRPFRAAVTAASPRDLAKRVREAASRPGAADVPALAGQPRVALVFTGQGSQWPGMAGGLLAEDRLFRSVIRRCDEAVAAELGWSIEAVLAGRQARDLHDTAVAQPLLAAIGIGLASVWRALGVDPVAVVGHSVGEVAAAVVAGALDLETGLRLAALRGRLMAAPGGVGAMLAVALDAGEAHRAAEGHPGVAVAAVNGPRAAVLSGDRAALEAVRTDLEGRGRGARWLDVGHAFHGPGMREAAAALTAELGPLVTAEPVVPFFSTVLGGRASARDLGAAYWGEGVRRPVEFAAAVSALLDSGADAVVEVGPRPALASAVRRLAEAAGQPGLLVVPSLDRDRDGLAGLLEGLGRLYALGCRVGWDYLFPEGGRVASLPPHPWDRERHWLERAAAPRAAAGQPVLGARLDLADTGGRATWESAPDGARLPGLGDHRVGGAAILPAAALVQMAAAAAAEAGLGAAVEVRDLQLHRPLPLGDERRPALVQVTLAPPDGVEGRALAVHSRSAAGTGQGEAAWTRHATARVAAAAGPEPAPAAGHLAEARARCPEPVAPAALYELLLSQGLDYGPAFRGVRSAHRGEGEAVGTLAVPTDGGSRATEALRLVDAAFHLVGAAAGGTAAGEPAAPAVPVAIEFVRWWSAPAGTMTAHARLHAVEAGRLVADVTLVDGAGQPSVEVRGLELRRAGAARPASATPSDTAARLYEPRWRERPRDATGQGPGAGRWVVLTGGAGPGPGLLAALERLGVAAVACLPGGSYAPPGPGGARIDPASPGDYSRLIADLATGPEPLAGAVHLWALEPPDDAALPAATVLHLVRALSVAAAGSAARLVVASRGCQPAGPAAGAARTHGGHLLAATAWGLLKTVPFENPLLRLACVDLDPGGGDDVAALLAELPDGPDLEVAYRAGRRFVRRLVELPAATATRPAGTLALRPDATYVVTGGTGGLGLLVAGRLVERGARRLVLVARGDARPGTAPALAALRSAGADVRLVRADVRDRGALAAALAAARTPETPIRGVVHAAGVLADGPLLEMPEGRLRDVLGPKVLGGWNLHELTLDDPLDFFVLYSSAAGVLGSPGQANYSAANAYLDALAHHRRRMGLPATAVDWGPWAGAGMAEGRPESSAGRRLRTAAAALDPADGLAALERLVPGGPPQTVVLPFDLRNLLQFYPAGAGMSFFEEIGDEEVRTLKTIGVQSSSRPDLATEYLAPRGPVEQRIAAIWQRSLGIELVGVLDNFFELGGDSVFGNQILLEVNRTLGVTIEPGRAFEDLTVAHLAQLAEQAVIERLDRMSDEEASRLLGA